MAQQEWDVLVCVVPSDKPPHYAGSVKAFTRQEAEERGARLAKGRGLIGLIEVLSCESVDHPNVNYLSW